jgi:hypothetical protein
VLALAQRCGFIDTVEQVLTVPSPNPASKLSAMVAGMVAGADSINDLDLLRHGGMGKLFAGVRTPSTLGTFLRSFTSHVRQLDKIAAGLLVNLAGHAPLLPGADQLCFVDIDDTVKPTYGYRKQGAGYGYNHVNGLNALLVTMSTPIGAPVIAASRLRRGPTSSPRGAASLVASALATARRCGASGLVLLRADSGFYNADVAAACRRAGARFSITAAQNKGVAAAIAAIPDDAWTPIHYPNAIFDDDQQVWISDAEVAETRYLAFFGRGLDLQVNGRLIVRRVKRLHPHRDQHPLIAGYRYHALFTDSALPMLQAEASHRGHAIVEQVIADLKNGPLAHLPSGRFAANAAWLACATIAYNLTRAAHAVADRCSYALSIG